MGIRPDIKQYYEIKAVIEQIFGNQAWLELKECTSCSTWRKYILKIIEAIRISLQESVEIKDEAWVEAVNQQLDRGVESAKSAKDVEDLLSGFTATLLRQVFLQVGMVPNRPSTKSVTLRKENWRLNDHRSVQYIQTPAQVEAAFWSKQQQEIGFERQMNLRDEYRNSKSKEPFSKWCNNKQA